MCVCVCVCVCVGVCGGEGRCTIFMLVPDMVKLIFEQVEVLSNTARLSIPTCHIVRSFVRKHFDPN